jgi:parallel beta-helix repeat protein
VSHELLLPWTTGPCDLSTHTPLEYPVNPRTSRSLFTALLLAASTNLALAGPLTPPAGPVISTGKTLTDVEPRIAISATNTPGDADSMFRITQPGSYYLTGNITATATRRGIEVASAGVHIDLNGYSIVGVSGALQGITIGLNMPGCSIRNGRITNFPSSGIESNSATTVHSVEVRSNGGAGIDLGAGSLVDSCLAVNNFFAGIDVDDDSIVRGCIANTNGGNGIRVGESSRIERSLANNNIGSGIQASNLTIVSHCITNNNTVHGIAISDQSTVENCQASSNGQNGFELGFGVRISNCDALINDLHGIAAGSSCVIINNHSRLNGNNGIGAGIFVEPARTRTLIMNNQVSGNDIGIDVDATFCLIKGNTATSNSVNFEIVANNRVATILSLPTNAAAISGNAGGTAVSDPDANYAF